MSHRASLPFLLSLLLSFSLVLGGGTPKQLYRSRYIYTGQEEPQYSFAVFKEFLLWAFVILPLELLVFLTSSKCSPSCVPKPVPVSNNTSSSSDTAFDFSFSSSSKEGELAPDSRFSFKNRHHDRVNADIEFIYRDLLRLKALKARTTPEALAEAERIAQEEKRAREQYERDLYACKFWGVVCAIIQLFSFLQTLFFCAVYNGVAPDFVKTVQFAFLLASAYQIVGLYRLLSPVFSPLEAPPFSPHPPSATVQPDEPSPPPLPISIFAHSPPIGVFDELSVKGAKGGSVRQRMRKPLSVQVPMTHMFKAIIAEQRPFVVGY